MEDQAIAISKCRKTQPFHLLEDSRITQTGTDTIDSTMKAHHFKCLLRLLINISNNYQKIQNWCFKVHNFRHVSTSLPNLVAQRTAVFSELSTATQTSIFNIMDYCCYTKYEKRKFQILKNKILHKM